MPEFSRFCSAIRHSISRFNFAWRVLVLHNDPGEAPNYFQWSGRRECGEWYVTGQRDNSRLPTWRISSRYGNVSIPWFEMLERGGTC